MICDSQEPQRPTLEAFLTHHRIEATRHEHAPVLAVDPDALALQLGAGRLGFASADRLMKHLGVTPQVPGRSR